MGRFVAMDSPAADAVVADAVARIGKAIDAMRIPNLAGVVLGGGYGRGEGGVIEECRLSNDLDFFAITEDGASAAEIAAIAAALEPISKEWTARIGIDVDFTVRTPWRIKHDEERLMIQELVRGYFDVAGERGETLFSAIRRIDAAEIPWTEAGRLMMNRGMGLMLAHGEMENGEMGNGERGTGNGERGRGFIVRNINKCVLGAGDARLIARRAYAWRLAERASALGDRLYAQAAEWKTSPRTDGVCDWETARTVWLSACEEVVDAARRSGDPGLSRNLFNALRWLGRRRTLGELRTIGRDPIVRILERLRPVVEARQSLPASLKKDWQIFN
jgi:hypothetical protein